MKRLLIALAALMVLGAGTAFATPTWVGSVSNDGGANWVSGVMGFDWSDAGSGFSLPTGPNPFDPVNPAIGQTFDFLYQAQLVAITGVGGGTIAWPGLADAFEVTFVAVLPEVVTGISVFPSGNATLEIATLGGGAWYMYLDSPDYPVTPGAPNANVGTGMGFDDGRLVASGTFLPGFYTTFTATEPGVGIGSFKIEGLIAVADGNPDPTFFKPTVWPDGSPLMFDLRFQGTANQPAENALTEAFFVSRAGEGNLTSVDVTGFSNLLKFKVDSSSTFGVIPEPSTVVLLGLGLLGLAGYSRRKMKK